MSTQETEQLKNRIRVIRTGQPEYEPKSVVYLMSRDQRINFNHCLLAAQLHSQKKSLPLIVVVALYQSFNSRPAEAFQFMIDGLIELEKELVKLGIPLVLRVGDSLEVIGKVERQLKPDAIYLDFSPLRSARSCRASLKNQQGCRIYEVDTHNIVPAWLASDKLEYAARTIRPKIHQKMPDFLEYNPSLSAQEYDTGWLGKTDFSRDFKPLKKHISYKESGIVHGFEPGEKAAKEILAEFIENKLEGYGQNRNDPTKDALSNLSPYLHFGQISSLEVALEVIKKGVKEPELKEDVDVLVEELVVRKELSDNWCLYNQDYDNLNGAPDWAKKTLLKHTDDAREFIYSFEELRDAKTHDPAWNASQIQLKKTGKMHGYMRMYWAKKVLEWTSSPEEAINYLIRLNDFYSLDGGDPNGYVGIMWSVAGVHDRPWQERPIYGTIRSMVFSGLKKKFDIESYIRTYNKL